ncbi:MAG: hypothetical protein ACI9EK_003065 [Psychroserpens sp.]|jgi:hypothetical protein
MGIGIIIFHNNENDINKDVFSKLIKNSNLVFKLK